MRLSVQPIGKLVEQTRFPCACLRDNTYKLCLLLLCDVVKRGADGCKFSFTTDGTRFDSLHASGCDLERARLNRLHDIDFDRFTLAFDGNRLERCDFKNPPN